MPHLAKRHISQYVRRSCKRRLRFDLYSNSRNEEVVRDASGNLIANPPPERDTARPGLPLLAEEGRRNEAERYEELAEIFPASTSRPVQGDPDAGPLAHGDGLIFRLEAVWTRLLHTPRFLIETEYVVPPAFQEMVALDEVVASALSNRAIAQTLTLGNARPDVIQAMAANPFGAMGNTSLPVQQITASGEIVGLPDGDARIGLRVIDCKLAAEASEAHFAEIAYYCMTLAAWLETTVDQDGRPLSERFFVRADAAVWPGRHGGSTMETMLREAQAAGREPTEGENLAAFEVDLDYLPAPVFSARVRRFFEADLRDALTPEDWKAIGYHVDSRCVGCEF